MKNSIHECPICKGEIQATRTEYMRKLVLDASGFIESDGEYDGSGDTCIYCENDHTHDEMIEALKKGKS